jgi:hypothetical protein
VIHEAARNLPEEIVDRNVWNAQRAHFQRMWLTTNDEAQVTT